MEWAKRSRKARTPYSLLARSFFLLVFLQVAPSAGAESDTRPILGIWRGTSVCVNREAAPACRDEEVIYEFRETVPPVAGNLIVKAAKVVDWKVVPMGVINIIWDPKEGAWLCDFQTPRFHGLWTYMQPKGDDLAGTLVSIPDRTLLRRVAARRQP